MVLGFNVVVLVVDVVVVEEVVGLGGANQRLAVRSKSGGGSGVAGRLSVNPYGRI